MPRGKGRHSETRVGALVRKHSVSEDGTPYSSVTALGRAIGLPSLTQTLGYAREERQFPKGELIRAVAAHLDDVGRAMLVDALAWDGQLPGYDVEDEPVQRQFSRYLRKMSTRKRALFLHAMETFAELPEVPEGFRFAAEVIDEEDDD